MKKETQQRLFNEFTQKQLEIINSKQHDYVSDVDNDVLENFKTAGANAGITTQQQLLSLIATKVARLGNLFKGKTPNNESIDDSVIDLANYVFLLHCSLNDIDYNSLMESEPLSVGEIIKMQEKGDLFTDMGLTKELTDVNDALKIEKIEWKLHPRVEQFFEEIRLESEKRNFKDNCY